MQLFGPSAITSLPQAQSTNGTNGSSGSSTTSGNSVSSLTSEQTFLQLLIAQIQNQDPLNPTDSIQFVGQLVQYAELEQLMNINSGVQSLDGSSTTSNSSTNGTDSNNGSDAVKSTNEATAALRAAHII
jgi:flagellar basal-body rod modification protein FlgD